MAEIFYTSDVHTYYWDTDYIRASAMEGGYFKTARHFAPDALIIDGGDVLQGSPFAQRQYKEGFPHLIQAEVMNAAGVAVYVPGNHDFDFGSELFMRFVEALDATLVCANLVDHSGRIKAAPYLLYTAADGITIAVVGVVTDYVNIWEGRETLGPLEVTDSVEAARAAYAAVRSEDADYTVLVYHGGYDDASHSAENRANELSALGFDILLTAHQHTVVHPYRLNGTLTLQAGSQAMHYAHVDLQRFSVSAAVLESGSGPVYEQAALSAVKARYEGRQLQLINTLAEPIGRTETIFSDRSKLDSALHGSTLADFFNAVQLRHTGSDISCVSLFNHPRSLGQVVTAGDVLAVYPFPNTLVVLQVDGKTLKQALERCASYFDLEEGRVKISDRFLIPKVEHYNYDYYQNLVYTFDLRQDLTKRVVLLEFDGIDLLSCPDYQLTLTLNNYRATGTGGYGFFVECPVIARYKSDVQDLILAEFAGGRTVCQPPPSTFSVIY